MLKNLGFKPNYHCSTSAQHGELQPQHKALIEASGITEDVAHPRGYRSVTYEPNSNGHHGRYLSVGYKQSTVRGTGPLCGITRLSVGGRGGGGSL